MSRLSITIKFDPKKLSKFKLRVSNDCACLTCVKLIEDRMGGNTPLGWRSLSSYPRLPSRWSYPYRTMVKLLGNICAIRLRQEECFPVLLTVTICGR